MTITPKKYAHEAKKYCQSEYDYLFVISGITGKGKSTLGIKIGQEFDPNFSYEHNMFYSQTKFKKAIREYPMLSFLQVDEAINMLYRREFYRKSQVDLLKDLDTMRNKFHCYCITLPNFWDLDSKLLNSSKIKSWIYVDQRGRGYIFRPDEHPYQDDPWNRKRNKKLFRNWRHKIHPKISPNYVDEIEWAPLDKQEFAKYEFVKDRKRLAAIDEMEKEEVGREKKWLNQRDRVVLELYNRGNITQDEIASLIDTTQQHVAHILEAEKKKIEQKGFMCKANSTY